MAIEIYFNWPNNISDVAVGSELFDDRLVRCDRVSKMLWIDRHLCKSYRKRCEQPHSLEIMAGRVNVRNGSKTDIRQASPIAATNADVQHITALYQSNFVTLAA
jgi:hypothetical protein